MHYRALLLVAWLVFFYNIERVRWFVGAGQIQFVTRYAYIFVALAALVTLALPAVHRLPLWLLGSAGVILYLIFKNWFGYPLWGEALAVTITEICAILVTGLLTRQVAGAIWEFENSIVNFTIRRVGRHTKAFDIEQGEMYQEVRRARTFERPLALMAVEPATHSIEHAREKMVEEVQQATMEQYVLAALAKELEDELGPYSIIAQDGDRFIVLLPEASKSEIPKLISQVRVQVQEALGLELRIGSSTLPEVETFDELVETAYTRMVEGKHKSEESAVPRAASVQGHVTSR
jgi:GGDEF domain-containing protein